MTGITNNRRSGNKNDDLPNPETEKILEELQGIRNSCSDQFKRFEKLLNEKKSKLDTFEDCIVNELRELQRKHEELKVDNENHVSKIAELEKIIIDKTERVKKIERKLTQAKADRDEVKESIVTESKSEYSVICEELQELKKTNKDLEMSEQVARSRLDKIIADKKAVEKAKTDVIKSKRSDQDFFFHRLKALESELQSCRQALGRNHSNPSMSSHYSTNHRSENHHADHDSSLRERMKASQTEHPKYDYNLEKKARRF